MGLFKVPIEIGDPNGERWEQVEAMVDTGASLTMIPRPLWDSLGLTADETRTFTLGDGRQVLMEVTETSVRIDGRQRANLVVAGPEGATPLLGALTLETFFLAPDPVGKKLVPVGGYLL